MFLQEGCPTRVAWIALVAAPLFLSSALARADETEPSTLLEQPVVVDHPVAEGGDARYQIDRTWLYGDDARVPLPMTVVATSSFSYTNVGSDPTQVSGSGAKATCGAQPCYSTFAGNTAQPGGTMILGGELGLLPHLSVVANVMVGAGGTGGVPSPDAGGLAGLRLQVLPSSWTHTHLVVGGGYVREAWNPPSYDDDNNKWIPGQSGGVNAAYFQVAMSGDIGRLRLAGTFHGQHTFADGRDPLDILVDLGATYRITGGFRAGVEYVGQDLEESFSPGAEGGPRHFIGPIASLQLWRDRLTLVAGPAVGLSYISPDFAARVAASASF